MRAHEWLPVILAVPVFPITIWSGWTGFRKSLHHTESEIET